MAVLHHPVRLQPAGAVWIGVRGRRSNTEATDHGAPRHLWVDREVLWHPRGEYSGRLPPVAEPRATPAASSHR
eukprot:37266-Eustigmatos_ZCMA.PRE.1